MSKRTITKLEIRNAADKDKPLEVVIYDTIGAGDYIGDGFTAKDFNDAIAGQDDGKRKLRVRLNSRGGDVTEGITVYNRLREWSGPSETIIDGDASSIASVIAMGAKEVRMPKSAQIMIHDAHAIFFASLDAEGVKSLVDDLVPRLEAASNRIANIYAERTKKSTEEMRALMKKTTVFTGIEAKAIGLADVLTDEAPLYNFSAEEIAKFRQLPGQQTTKTPPANRGADNQPNHMREQIIATLNKHGVKFDLKATDEQLVALLDSHLAALSKPAAPATATAAAPSADIINLTAELAAIRKERDAEKKANITARIDSLIANDQLPGAKREQFINRAIADPSILDEYAALPSVPPGAAPLGAVAMTSEDPREVGKALLANFGGTPNLTAAQARERGIKRANIIAANFDKLIKFVNTNTVSTDLKRTVILQQMIRAFAIKILPLNAFSTVLSGVRLEGTDKVSVPYFPLITTTSTDFVAANGYDTVTNSNSDAKAITVDKRKYQHLRWTSAEVSRQPYQDMAMAAQLASEQLGLDVVNDVLSIILAATYTNTAYSQPAAAFDSDDVAELKGRADVANWPAAMRSLIVNSAYDVNLLKDSAVKNAQAFGDNGPIREGRILRIGGFDYYADARVPTNSENLQGFIVWKSALLVAFAPVDPTPEVRSQLTRYEVVTEPTTGAQFEYRMWGNPDLDQTREVVESNYGKLAGEATALTRITT